MLEPVALRWIWVDWLQFGYSSLATVAADRVNRIVRKPLIDLVGPVGFEPTTT